MVERIDTPGAATSSCGPIAEFDAGVPIESIDATATTSGQRAGTATPFAPVLPAAATRTAPCDIA
jgi:hypothetical protein